jgi:threonine/homoserine/homoserine lactone efflux protein
MGDSLTFFVIAFFLVISPGANLMLLLKTVTTKGRNAGLLNVSGFVSGVFVHGTLAMLGLSQIIVQSSELFFMIKVIGAIYLAYLGAKIIYQSFIKVNSQSDTTLPEKKEQSIFY